MSSDVVGIGKWQRWLVVARDVALFHRLALMTSCRDSLALVTCVCWRLSLVASGQLSCRMAAVFHNRL